MSHVSEIDQNGILEFLSQEDNSFQFQEVATEDLIVPEHQVPTEEVTPEVIEEIIPEAGNKETEEFKAIQVLIKTGQLEDATIEIDGAEIKLSEFKNIDEDTLKDVLNAIEEEKKTSLKSDYIKVKDLDEKRKALIDIITSGDMESVRDILKDPKVLEEPMKGYDVNNPEHNAYVYYDYLTKVKGLDDEDAKGLVQASINNFTIDKKALEIVETTKKSHLEMLQNKAKEIKEFEKQEKENLKNYTKELNTTLQSYELKPEKVLEITKIATQKDTDGNLLIDNLYEEIARDPKRAAELFLFMNDKELYDKRVGAQAKTTAEISFAKKIKLIPESRKKTNDEIEQPQERRKNIEDFLMEDFKTN